MFAANTIFLVVDDVESMRKINAAQLRTLGAHNILLANNGADALRILTRQPVNVILSDWNMPVMDGLELLQTVRAHPRLAHLPFIMITAESDRAQILQAAEAGVSDILLKPYTSQEMGQRVERAMQRQPREPVAHRTTAAASPEAPGAAAERSEQPREKQRPTLLVVDDIPDNLMLISGLFKDEFRVRIAHNGQKALDICTSDDPPDLLLLDIMMPDMDGFQVAEQLREHPTACNLPLIFITAMTDAESRQKGLELGAVDFVTKPIDPALLQLRVRNLLRYVALHKNLQTDYDNMLELSRLREDVERITRHDLKGPLAGIIGLVQNLANECKLKPQQAEMLHLVEESSLQLMQMVNLSNELYKIETGRFQLDAKPIDLALMLRRLLGTSGAAFAEKELQLDLQLAKGGNPQGLGDAMLCYSLLQNLLKNACEAAPPQSQVNLRLSQEDGRVQLCMENHPAVPLEIRERFFDKFATYGKQGGTGLGTYSAKLLSEAQHGQLELQVDDDADLTRLLFSLPSAAAQPPV
ncbi:hybrid sensor histidine kinase/response regulator [Pseudomonas sp. J452]|uniref:ATP-binding response regulator n=1 Tax=Pseudomonas sp. J452 TaxID=2898441 RepID=UPI0021AD7A8A|nr:hybrid sensor histidine kinase/response regulator [Pseudomonas sp. J452]UUY08143.1 hybrid sensor histidine kinase/response regulator [Pseudomonas sp. J452]